MKKKKEKKKREISSECFSVSSQFLRLICPLRRQCARNIKFSCFYQFKDGLIGYFFETRRGVGWMWEGGVDGSPGLSPRPIRQWNNVSLFARD